MLYGNLFRISNVLGVENVQGKGIEEAIQYRIKYAFLIQNSTAQLKPELFRSFLFPIAEHSINNYGKEWSQITECNNLRV